MSSDLYAALDLGSNSFHLLVGRLVGGKIETVDRVKVTVRLAAGLQADRTLSKEAQSRALVPSSTIKKEGNQVNEFKHVSSLASRL